MPPSPTVFKSRKSSGIFLAVLLILSASVLALSGCEFPSGLPFLSSPTPTLTPTPTFTPTPIATATPTPTPVPTLSPALRIEKGEQELFYGDYDAALDAFIRTLEINPGIEDAWAAQVGIGKTYWLSGDSDNALRTLQDFVEANPEAGNLHEAYYFLARILREDGRPGEAAQAYRRFLELQPGILDSFVNEQLGDALVAAGQYLEAVQAYTFAINAPDAREDNNNLLIKVGDAFALAGDPFTALAQYTTVAENTTDEYLKAAMALKRGAMLENLGQVDDAFAVYEESVALYPKAYDAYVALLRILDAGRTVSELDRGLADYYAGEYSLAVFAFDRYLNNTFDDHDGTAHYFKGLALREIGLYPEAIAEFQELIETHGETDPYWADAWEQLADTQWIYLEDIETGLATYLTFISTYPEHPRTAEFLFYAARISERNGDLEAAARLWERIDTDYPLDTRAYRARFLAGITRFRLGQFEQARHQFQAASEKPNGVYENSQSGFWLGKTLLALGQVEEAKSVLESTAALDPTGYYSERALDLMLGRTAFSLSEPVDLDPDRQAELDLAEGWLRVIFALPDEVEVTGVGPLSGDPRFVRGTALWRLLEYEQARLEFESLRTDIQTNPLYNFQLANYLEKLGLYRTAIFSAREVLNIAGMDDAGTLHAPPWFNQIRFGLYYREIVVPEAESRDLPPLLVYSLMRQESLYEGFVHSSAGARGLMQIIPSTAASIQQNMGWPENYTPDDLYRPLVSIRFGINYLSSQRNYFLERAGDGPIHLYAALAAYNGGPGNADAWLALSQNDPDLYLEVVRFDETQRYIRSIYEIFNLYRDIYTAN